MARSSIGVGIVRAGAVAWAWTVSVARAQAGEDVGLSSEGVLNRALSHYRDAAGAWTEVAQQAAEELFWSLAVISLVWTAIQLTLRRAELGEIARELITFMMLTGFWAWMMRNGPAHAELITTSLVQLGGQMTGTPVTTPSGIIDVGFELLDKAQEAAAWYESPVAFLLGLMVVVLLAIVAASLVQVLVAGWIVAYGGVIVLGFGGARWTSDMAINYYRTCLAVGLHALSTILLVGAGEAFMQHVVSEVSPRFQAHEAAVALVSALILTILVLKVPAQVSALASGAGGLHHGVASPPIPGYTATRTATTVAGWAGTALGKVPKVAGTMATGAVVGGAMATIVGRDLIDGWFGRSGPPGGGGGPTGGGGGGDGGGRPPLGSAFGELSEAQPARQGMASLGSGLTSGSRAVEGASPKAERSSPHSLPEEDRVRESASMAFVEHALGPVDGPAASEVGQGLGKPSLVAQPKAAEPLSEPALASEPVEPLYWAEGLRSQGDVAQRWHSGQAADRSLSAQPNSAHVEPGDRTMLPASDPPASPAQRDNGDLRDELQASQFAQSALVAPPAVAWFEASPAPVVPGSALRPGMEPSARPEIQGEALQQTMARSRAPDPGGRVPIDALGVPPMASSVPPLSPGPQRMPVDAVSRRTDSDSNRDFRKPKDAKR